MEQHNGSGRVVVGGGRPMAIDAPPDAVRDLAAACVGFVGRATGVTLDFEPETLSVLDHYVAQTRASAQEKPEIAALVARSAGAYLGEVVRRRYSSWWRVKSSDPAEWRIEFEEVYLSFCPVELVSDALLRADDESRMAEHEAVEAYGALELLDDDREAARTRLADLPDVSAEEFYAPSTRLEVIDITVEAIRARRIAAGEEAHAALAPRDYDDD